MYLICYCLSSPLPADDMHSLTMHCVAPIHVHWSVDRDICVVFALLTFIWDFCLVNFSY